MITLCILFNHAFPSNIPLLREIYRDRFSDILFLQPIELSEDDDVITSYRGSYNFHGMVADALPRLLARKSDHYVFIHDDILLNPKLDANNLVSTLRVRPGGSFITNFSAAGGQINSPDHPGWQWIVGALWKMLFPTNTVSGSGVQSSAKLLQPITSRRTEMEEKYGFKFQPYTYDVSSPPPQVDPFGSNQLSDDLVRLIFRGLFDHSVDPPCLTSAPPLCVGYSDFFVVDGSAMKAVGEMLGVLAALGLFVEMAIPTALAALTTYVTQAQEVGMRGEWTYDPGITPAQTVIDGFRSDVLLRHPIKPSRDRDFIEQVLRAFA